jgi:hypothetical protein
MVANGSVTMRFVETGESCRWNRKHERVNLFRTKFEGGGGAVTTVNHEANTVSTAIQFLNQTVYLK